MNFQLLIAFLLTSSISIAQDSTMSYYPNGKIHYIRTNIDSSHFFERSYYETGQLKGELTAVIINDSPKIKSGKTYFESGKLRSVQNDTIKIKYLEDGSIYQICQYRNLQPNGITKTYLGKAITYEMEFKNGIQDGLIRSYQNGKILEEWEAQEVVKNGLDKHFDEHGRLKKILYYRKGCPYRAEYFDSNEKLIKAITDKDKIQLSEGSQPDCQ